MKPWQSKIPSPKQTLRLELDHSNTNMSFDTMRVQSSTPQSPTSNRRLERALSSRRVPHHTGDVDDDDDDYDVSKTKKNHFSFFTHRFSNYFARIGPIWTCLSLIALILLLISALIFFHSRRFVCVSSYDPVSRSGFFGMDGLDSDFGSLGVPCCKFSSLPSFLVSQIVHDPFYFSVEMLSFRSVFGGYGLICLLN